MSLSEQTPMAILEDVTDKVLRKVSPWSRVISKICILFFHFFVAFMILIEYTHMKLFIKWVCGLDVFDRKVSRNYVDEEGKEQTSVGYQDTIVTDIATILVFITRVIPLGLIIAKKHVIPACIGLSLLPLCMTVHYIVNTPTSSFYVIYTCLALMGSLGMLIAENLDNKADVVPGIPSLGINRPMGLVTLIARVIVLAVYLQCYSSLGRYLWYPVFYFFLVISLPLVVSVLVGYKTKITAVMLAGLLCAEAVYLFPWTGVIEGGYLMFVIHVATESALFTGIGGLLHLATLGAGRYSVDELKRNN